MKRISFLILYCYLLKNCCNKYTISDLYNVNGCTPSPPDVLNHRWKHWLNNMSLKLILLISNLGFRMVVRLKFDDTYKIIWQVVGQ